MFARSRTSHPAPRENATSSVPRRRISHYVEEGGNILSAGEKDNPYGTKEEDDLLQIK